MKIHIFKHIFFAYLLQFLLPPAPLPPTGTSNDDILNFYIKWHAKLNQGFHGKHLPGLPLQNNFYRTSREDTRCQLNTVDNHIAKVIPRQLPRSFKVPQSSGQGRTLKRINREFLNLTRSKIITMVRRTSKG